MLLRSPKFLLSKTLLVYFVLSVMVNVSSSLDYQLDIDPDINLELVQKQAKLLKMGRTERSNFVVELALICDRDFSSLFQYDKSKMLEYWQAVFYDVQLRFRTLPSVNFTFRVTYFRALETADQQPFVEQARRNVTMVSVEEALSGFRNWMHSKAGWFPTFDIAILALGSQSSDGLQGIAQTSSICLGELYHSKWISNVVFSVRNADTANVVAHEIAHVLGAPHDDHESYIFNDCGHLPKHGYIMSSNGGIKRQWFSACSDKILANKFNGFQLDCLDNVTRIMAPIIDTKVSQASSLTFLDQCRIMRNDSSVFLKQDEANCSFVTCRSGADSTTSVRNLLLPLNGSPCIHRSGNAGICFWGGCIQAGIFLMGSDSSSCVTVTKAGKVTATECFNLFKYPMDAILLKNGSKGIALMKPFWTYEDDLQIKCFTMSTVSETDFVPNFDECSPYAGWDIQVRQVSCDNNEFILFHRHTRTCLKLDASSGKLQGTRNCSSGNLEIGWRFLLANGSILTHANFEEVIEDIATKTVNWEWYDVFLVVLGMVGTYKFVAFVTNLCFNFGKHLVRYITRKCSDSVSTNFSDSKRKTKDI